MQSRFKSQMFLVYTMEKERNNNKITRTFPSFVCCRKTFVRLQSPFGILFVQFAIECKVYSLESVAIFNFEFNYSLTRNKV